MNFFDSFGSYDNLLLKVNCPLKASPLYKTCSSTLVISYYLDPNLDPKIAQKMKS